MSDPHDEAVRGATRIAAFALAFAVAVVLIIAILLGTGVLR